MAVDKVLLASPRGYCAGVEMAIKALTWLTRVFDGPVYCFHEIVHNKLVVERFEQLGVIFVEKVADIPLGAPAMLSAHGSAPEVVINARDQAGVVVNAVCPLVTKVHHELKVRADKGYAVVYIGHEGHDETVGTMAVAPTSVHLVEKAEDVVTLALDAHEPVALLAQTTLAHADWADIRDSVLDRYPQAWMPGKSDLCFATTNRQTALGELVKQCDAILVIGSANSSNTVALERMARLDGATNVTRINSQNEIPEGLHGIVGVTSGASAPEDLVQDVLTSLQPRDGVQEVRVVEEDEYFPPPKELRLLMQQLVDIASASICLDRIQPTPLSEDRQSHAMHAFDI